MKNKLFDFFLIVAMILIVVFVYFNRKKTGEYRNILTIEKSYLIDSIVESESNKRIFVIDSIISKKDSIIAFYKKKSESNKKVVEKSIVEYKADTSCIGCCDSIIFHFENLENSLNSEILELNEENILLCEKVSLKDTILHSKENYITSLNDNIKILTVQLNKKNNWWNKNKFWVGFTTGIIGTVTGAYILSR